MKGFGFHNIMIIFYLIPISVFSVFAQITSLGSDNRVNNTQLLWHRQKRDSCGYQPYQSNGSPDRELLFHPESRQCFQTGIKGPCGNNMIFYQHPYRSNYGFCDCDQGYKSRKPCSDYPVRRMIYVPKFKQCFPAFSQGPCLNGFWLNFDAKTENPICEWNPCLKYMSMSSSKDYLAQPVNNDGSEKFWFYDPIRKSCYQTQDRGYCPASMKLELTHDSHIPRCRRKLCHGALTSFRSSLVCKKGSRFSYLLKGCIKKSPQRVSFLG